MEHHYCYIVYRKLEEDLMLCENEKMCLQNKVKQLERNISAKRTNKFDSDEDRLSSDLKSSNDCEQNKIKTVIKSAANEKAEDTDTKDKRQYTVPVVTIIDISLICVIFCVAFKY